MTDGDQASPQSPVDLTHHQAMRLLGIGERDLADLVDRGELPAGTEPSRLRAAPVLDLALRRHQAACDAARRRMADTPSGGYDIQGRPVREPRPAH